jgi:hypothetical protein
MEVYFSLAYFLLVLNCMVNKNYIFFPTNIIFCLHCIFSFKSLLNTIYFIASKIIDIIGTSAFLVTSEMLVLSSWI